MAHTLNAISTFLNLTSLNNNIYISGTSKSYELDNFWKDDFERGDTNTFHLDDVKSVGTVTCIKLYIDGDNGWTVVKVK